MQLVRDVLDMQLCDADDLPIGKVDGIVLELRDGEPPRVVAIEVGPITLLRRFGVRLAAWYAKLDRHFGPGRGVPYRIAWSRLAVQRVKVQANLRSRDTPVNAAENWLNEHVVKHLPGG
jgi:hypothetical protein